MLIMTALIVASLAIDQISLLVFIILSLVSLFLSISRPALLIAIMPLFIIFLVPGPVSELSFERILAIFLFISWLLRKMIRHEKFSKFSIFILASAFPFLIAILTSLFGGVDFGSWFIKGIVYWLNRILIIVILYEMLNTEEQSRLAMRSVIWTSLFLCIIVISMSIFFCGRLDGLRAETCHQIPSNDYIKTLFVAVNTHAFTFAVALLFSWSLFFTKRRQIPPRKLSPKLILPTMIFLVAILGYTLSRRGTLFLIPLILFFMWNYRKSSIVQIIFIGLLAVSVLIAFSQKEEDPLRIEETFNELQTSQGDRIPVWKLTMEEIKKKPIFGWGAGAPNYIVIAYMGREYTLSSTMLQIAFEMGVFGVISFSFFLFQCAKNVIKKIRNELNLPGYDRQLNYTFTALAMLSIFIISSIVGNNLQNIFSWYSLGVAFSLTKYRTDAM